MKRGTNIYEQLKPLAEQTTQAVITNTLQIADIMQWIATQIGDCSLVQTSFSISEEFIRRLYFLKKKSNLQDITLILDHKAMNKAVKLWPFLTQVVQKTFMAYNHSKVLLFTAQSGTNVAVITSQNLTRGGRYESTLITTEPQVCRTLTAQLQNIIEYAAAPLGEKLADQLTANV